MPMNGLGTGFAGLVALGGIVPALPACSRDAALLALAHEAAGRAGLTALKICDRLRARELQDSTAVGSGAAIPHARLAGLTGCVVLLARLPQPIDWQALDGRLVDVLVLLLSPIDNDADHLKALARISRTLRDPDTLPAVRAAASANAMLAAVSPQPALAG
jgi:PTS system nitrogen regulatory IIA component